MIRRYLPQNVEQLIHSYERYVSPFALIGGFLLDTFFFLDRVDVLSGNLLLLSYLSIAALGIVLLNAIEAGHLRQKFFLTIAPFVPVLVQFAFGGLFSGYLSLYGRSAGPVASWIFVIAIAGLLIGNERFRRLYTRYVFQISIWFTALFSFLIFFLPVLFKSIGPWMFILSGALSMGAIALLLYLIERIAPEIARPARQKTLHTIVAIFITFNVLYFANIIPPLPLAMKDGGVYYSVQRVGSEYRLETESASWYRSFFLLPAIVHASDTDSLYAYTSVFAPTGLRTEILHEWQRYDEIKNEWLIENTVSFSIVGGRDGGYRGYSLKNGLQPGSWRVNVLTSHGQSIGRISFTVEEKTAPPLLELIIR